MSETSTHGYWNWTGFCTVTFTYHLESSIYKRRVVRAR